MTASPSRHLRRHAAIHARDGALRRLQALNRVAGVGSVALVLGFTALAAKATPPRHHTAGHAVAPVTRPAGAAGDTPALPASRDDGPAVAVRVRHHHHHHHRSAAAVAASTSAAAPAPAPAAAAAAPAPAQTPAPAASTPAAPAPAPTTQPPVVISGGS